MITATAGSSGGGGTILLLTTNGADRVLYDFSAPDGNLQNSDGANAEAGLTVGADGNFYGVTTEGGTNGSGTVFRLTFPTLAITRSGNTAVLSWPTNQVGFALEWTTNLGRPNWTALTNVVVVGDQFVVSSVGGGTRGFYNLVK